MVARLSSSVLAGGLLRLAQAEGGFGAVLAKGEPDAGAVTIILREKGARPRVFARLLQADGSYSWQAPHQHPESESQLEAFLERRRRFDPDLWIIELDVACAERFAAEMNSLS